MKNQSCWKSITHGVTSGPPEDHEVTGSGPRAAPQKKSGPWPPSWASPWGPHPWRPKSLEIEHPWSHLGTPWRHGGHGVPSPGQPSKKKKKKKKKNRTSCPILSPSSAFKTPPRDPKPLPNSESRSPSPNLILGAAALSQQGKMWATRRDPRGPLGMVNPQPSPWKKTTKKIITKKNSFFTRAVPFNTFQ